jgi:hypothetical protein
MARKVLVRLVDDLDGLPSEDVATVTFSLDRVDYQIDLNESNASKLREGLADFITAARRTGGRIKRGAGASARAAGHANDGPAIREWAREQGHQLAERGRIPSHIVDAFHAANGKGRAKVTRIADATPAEKPARRTAAKTAAASRSAASTTATTATRRTRSAAEKPAAKATTAKPAAKTTKATAAKATDKAPKAAAKTTKTPRATASTAAKGGQRAARRTPAAKSR